jgi:hypothetical protein
MSEKRVPPVAAWILEQFSSDPRNENLMGDLAEQFAAGRSRAWYWRQALRAVVGSYFQEAWNHKVIALIGLLVGFFAWELRDVVWLWTRDNTAPPWWLWYWEGWIWTSPATVLVAWAVAYAARDRRNLVMLSFLLSGQLWWWAIRLNTVLSPVHQRGIDHFFGGYWGYLQSASAVALWMFVLILTGGWVIPSLTSSRPRATASRM